MAAYQMAVIEDVGEPYIHTWYQCEGDSPFILAGEKIFSKLENAMNGIEKSTKQLTVMPLGIRLLQEVYNAFHESIEAKNLLMIETNERIQALKKDIRNFKQFHF